MSRARERERETWRRADGARWARGYLTDVYALRYSETRGERRPPMLSNESSKQYPTSKTHIIICAYVLYNTA